MTDVSVDLQANRVGNKYRIVQSNMYRRNSRTHSNEMLIARYAHVVIIASVAGHPASGFAGPNISGRGNSGIDEEGDESIGTISTALAYALSTIHILAVV